MSNASKLRLIRSARDAGFSDVEILREVLRGVYGSEKRRQMVVEWGQLLGRTPSEALRIAHAAGLIASAHPPRGDG
jgi:hypothetical protein